MTDKTNGNPLIEWAVSQWNAQVKFRPLQNVHRRSMDSVWRQVIRWAGGDPESLVGPAHDVLLARERTVEAPDEKPRFRKTNLTVKTPDINGYVPDPQLLGAKIHHTGNGKTYVICGFTFMGETDEWGYQHFADGEMGPIITRPMSNLYGNRDNGVPRYTRVD